MTSTKKSPKAGNSAAGNLVKSTRKGSVELKESDLDKATGGAQSKQMKWPE